MGPGMLNIVWQATGLVKAQTTLCIIWRSNDWTLQSEQPLNNRETHQSTSYHVLIAAQSVTDW